MRNFALKIGDMYRMYGNHYTANPNHPEIIRCTLEDAFNIQFPNETIVVSPVADHSKVILRGMLPDGRSNEATYDHRQFIHEWADYRTAEGHEVIIKVLGENGYYSHKGFSKEPIIWGSGGINDEKTQI